MSEVAFHGCSDRPGNIIVSVGGEVPSNHQKGLIVDVLNSREVTVQFALRERIILLEDLLTSARAIAQRKGAETAWERFDERLANAGIGWVTAKVFMVLPSDSE